MVSCNNWIKEHFAVCLREKGKVLITLFCENKIWVSFYCKFQMISLFRLDLGFAPHSYQHWFLDIMKSSKVEIQFKKGYTQNHWNCPST